MAKSAVLSLQERFKYDESVSSKLVWTAAFHKPRIGQPAGSINSLGYWQVKVGRKVLLGHRIVWEIINGPIPEGWQIDHINHNRADNSIDNLRLVTPTANHRNLTLSKASSSGTSGVTWNSRNKKWGVRIYVDGKPKRFGLYSCLEEAKQVAAAAYASAGYHLNHGAANDY